MSNMQELAEALRNHVERRAQSTMSSESIANVANILIGVSATLREDLNRRVPLFQFPAEILQQILEHVPGPLSDDHDDFRPSWRSSATDTSMLTPVLQTCRQLRRIALSHKSLWKTVSPARRYGLPPVLLREDCDMPLVVVIDGTLGVGALGNPDEVDASRIRELHVLNLRILQFRDDIAKIRQYFRTGMPLLESLSISHVFTDISDACPFSLDDAPRLRHMMLQSVTFMPTNAFPHLTHLALSDVYVLECHSDTAGLLSRCPNLESIAIHYPLTSSDMNYPQPLAHPLTLNRLCRVALQLPQFCDQILEFYLSVFPLKDWNHRPIALQNLGLKIMDDAVSQLGPPLFLVTKGVASHLSILLHPHPKSGRPQYVTMTATGPKGTFHVSTALLQDVNVEPDEEDEEDEGEGLPEGFLGSILCDPIYFHAVREIWITGLPPGREHYRELTESFKATIAGLPALETIVFVDVVARVRSQLELDLSVCPSAHDPDFASHRLKTLRIVCGNRATRTADTTSAEEIRLTNLLDQVGAGAYGYFENVLLQMTRRLVVDGKDLARLKAHFPTVTFQHIDSIPTMPLPEYCTEPYAGPGGSSTWHGSLW